MARNVIFLDTQALLWWAVDPERLSSVARERCAEMNIEGGDASSISLWELGIKIARGKRDIGLPIEEFARRVDASGVVTTLAVDARIWLKSLQLDGNHRDPADRVIVASALLTGVPLLTKDLVLRDDERCPTVW
ncbi:MAG: type II toxin-antitoxin system VapC family toxin [Myxococcota bacterium]